MFATRPIPAELDAHPQPAHDARDDNAPPPPSTRKRSLADVMSRDPGVVALLNHAIAEGVKRARSRDEERLAAVARVCDALNARLKRLEASTEVV